MKNLFGCLAVILILAIGLAMPVAAADIFAEADGMAVEFTDAKPFVDGNGRALVPLRPIADALGMEVDWDEESRQAVFYKTYDENSARLYDAKYGFLGYEKIIFSVDSTTAVYYESWEMVNKSQTDGTSADDTADAKEESRDIIMDTNAIIVEGRIYAPVRYLAEAFGYTVSWNDADRTIVITSPDYEPVKPPEDKPAVIPVLSNKSLDEHGFFSIIHLAVNSDIGGYMNIYYEKDYEGLKVKDIIVTSARMDGADISCEPTQEESPRSISSLEKAAAFEIGLPRGVSSYKGNRTYSFEFTVDIEYSDGSKIRVNDSKLIYVLVG